MSERTRTSKPGYRSKFTGERSFWSKRVERTACRFGTMPKNVSAGRRECRHYARRIFLLSSICIFAGTSRSPGQISYTDNFNVPLSYLTNGAAGTIWDGVYFGAGEFNNT